MVNDICVRWQCTGVKGQREIWEREYASPDPLWRGPAPNTVPGEGRVLERMWKWEDAFSLVRHSGEVYRTDHLINALRQCPPALPRTGDVLRLPFQDERFDTVLLHHVLQHLYADERELDRRGSKGPAAWRHPVDQNVLGQGACDSGRGRRWREHVPPRKWIDISLFRGRRAQGATFTGRDGAQGERRRDKVRQRFGEGGTGGHLPAMNIRLLPSMSTAAHTIGADGLAQHRPSSPMERP